ncbi:DUF2384 domain-containing protein [Bradyrhizobium sp. 190]|jgi:uncharacterized protein (DUF2384 family)|uniref:antitoxin Xre/MbcA/ParS toxin-binding domain-containing protein n=1 Tax=Bradyrhizobium sp. 190 TaxID=2782658 RepID=UPI001FF8D720|nr:antitoxin Xre/MbcA/ParS toxin-binding domain-containing protein [Bradyrhizobium sp. 190]MCK1513082.1 DUF2384 domain-containing protein [Bradyrhizobium sp. 190]
MPPAATPAETSANASPSRALDVFFKIADAWKLSIEQQITLLGAPARSTFYKWKKEGGLLSTDTEDRISHLAAIYKALQIVVPDPHAADTWIERPNKYFGGRTALDVMLDGKLTDIYAVRVYLDAQRGG